MNSNTYGYGDVFLPSPTSSSATSTSTATSAILPSTRSHPLVPGSQKEIAFIEYVDARILQISRRYAKKFSNENNEANEAAGYDDFNQVVQDLEAVFNIVWISGTPSLQVPYLLSLAGLLCSYLPAFPFKPTPTFRMARRFDAAFTYLIQNTSNSVFGLSGHKYEVSGTDKVRMKSLASATRVAAIDSAGKSGYLPQLVQVTDDEETDQSDEPTQGTEEEIEDIHDQIAIGLARLYRQTMDLLGDDLG